jgi:hypothetical protein
VRVFGNAVSSGLRVVVRQEHDLAGVHFDRLTAFCTQLHASGSHEMEGDHVPGCREKRPAILGRDLTADAPGCRELRLEEHSSGQAHHTQDIR